MVTVFTHGILGSALPATRLSSMGVDTPAPTHQAESTVDRPTANTAFFVALSSTIIAIKVNASFILSISMSYELSDLDLELIGEKPISDCEKMDSVKREESHTTNDSTINSTEHESDFQDKQIDNNKARESVRQQSFFIDHLCSSPQSSIHNLPHHQMVNLSANAFYANLRAISKPRNRSNQSKSFKLLLATLNRSLANVTSRNTSSSTNHILHPKRRSRRRQR